MRLSHRIGASLAAIGVSVILGFAGAAPAPALAAEGEGCPNEQLRGESNLNPELNPETHTRLPYSMELPDCRGYEMVSPPYAGGEKVAREYISSDGQHLVVKSFGLLPGGSSGSVFGAMYELTRTAAGWEASVISPPGEQFSAEEFDAESRDFSATLFLLRRPTQPLRADSFYIRDPANADGSCPSDATAAVNACFVEVGSAVPPSYVKGPPDPTSLEIGVGAKLGVYYRGASGDLSHIVFAAQHPEGGRWPGDTAKSGESLFEYVGTGNTEPKLVGVSNTGSFAHNTEASLISDCQTELGYGSGVGAEFETYNAISISGATVFFTATGHSDPECEAEEKAPAVTELYARVGEEKTVAVSEPPLSGPGAVAGRECTGTCETSETIEADRSPAVFQGASEDGSKVFFMTEQPLLNAAVGAGNDLYEEEVEGAGMDAKIGKLIQVSHDPNAGQAAEVQGVARVSEDGSHVYFVAKGVLTAEQNSVGRQALAGADNLYVYERDSAHPSGQLRFIATLLPQDATDWTIGDQRPVQATPNGEFLVFQSAADLTPDDTSTAAQIFEYDARTGELVRVSIGQCAAAQPTCSAAERFNSDGNTTANPASILTRSFEVFESPTSNQSRLSLSEDGSYVFFTSADGLAPSATAGVGDVYEYHWGDGALSDGNVRLLADGQRVAGNEANAQMLGADASGQDAFVSTPLQLVGQDTNTQWDIYDARIDGGFPAPVSPVQCIGEACQGSIGAPPSLPSAASTAAPAIGNLIPGSTVFPPSVQSKPKPKPLTKAQELAKALKACAKDKHKQTRKTCEKTARGKYGTAKKQTKKKG